MKINPLENQLYAIIMEHFMSSCDTISDASHYASRDINEHILSFFDWLCFHSQDVIELVSYWNPDKQENKRVFVLKGSRSVMREYLSFEQIYQYWHENIFHKNG